MTDIFFMDRKEPEIVFMNGKDLKKLIWSHSRKDVSIFAPYYMLVIKEKLHSELAFAYTEDGIEDVWFGDDKEQLAETYINMKKYKDIPLSWGNRYKDLDKNDTLKYLSEDKCLTYYDRRSMITTSVYIVPTCFYILDGDIRVAHVIKKRIPVTYLIHRREEWEEENKDKWEILNDIRSEQIYRIDIKGIKEKVKVIENFWLKARYDPKSKFCRKKIREASEAAFE